ncbi:MAG TPA: helix-turn-helix domain-containing protein, partial [Kiritimatiellia bacterium]
MESIGQRFKTARERKRVSLSQAAAKTRIKVQVLEAMEQDDFSKIPAPTYARGFIRMYSEFLGLESGPLVQEFNALKPGGKGREEAAPPKKSVVQAAPPPPREEAAGKGEETAAPAAGAGPVSSVAIRRAAYLVGAVVLVVIAIGLFSRGPGKEPADDIPPKPVAPKRDLSAIIDEPRAPYIEASA